MGSHPAQAPEPQRREIAAGPPCAPAPGAPERAGLDDLDDLFQRAGRAGAASLDEASRKAIELASWLCRHEDAEAERHRAALEDLTRHRRELREWLVALLDGPGRMPPTSDARAGGRRRGTDRDAPRASTQAGTPAGLPASPLDPERSSIAVHCLGTFRVFLGGHEVEGWRNGRGKAIFKFLVAHHTSPVGKEVLMELLWPMADPDAARNNLNVAVYGLRRTFSSVYPSSSSVVLFRDGCYLVNPEFDLWIDHEAFLRHVESAHAHERARDPESAVREYRNAEALYQGDFLEEDRYDDWPEALRRRLAGDYVEVLDRLAAHYFEIDDLSACVNMCSKMLAAEPCHEHAHRRLMRCWLRQGLPHLALRQFDICRSSLARDLRVVPSAETTELLEEVRRQGAGVGAVALRA